MLDEKINTHFAGNVVRKDLTKIVKGNAIVPSYVLEYLLGQFCATDDVDSIEVGIEKVKEVLAKHYVHRNEAGLVKSNIREKGRWKVIDKVSVELNSRDDVYEASFSNLGIKNVTLETNYVKKHPKLLVSGVWCIVDLEYSHSEEAGREPWVIDTLKPIQVSNFDFEKYCEARKQFSTDEWIDVLVQSIGFKPDMLGRRQKLLQVARLIPFCERNYNYVELGPKGTGKSHIFSEFSPHGMIVSGAEVTPAKLFVNNASSKLGLVGYWDSVAFDEFAGKDKKSNRVMVDIMKQYMANKSFSRGVEVLGAEASMSFLGNTSKDVPYMLKHTHLFQDLPENYLDSAFLDRIHFYSPGWETNVIRTELYTEGFGFIVDYLAECMKTLRNEDYSQLFTRHFELNKELSTRDREGIQKTFSGLMKTLHPSGKCSKDEVKELLEFSIEGRKRVKDHILRIDDTFAPVEFSFADKESEEATLVSTLEEILYPELSGNKAQANANSEQPEENPPEIKVERNDEKEELVPGKHLVVRENEKGHTFAKLFGPYLEGARKVTVNDPYIRLYFQIKNMMELLEVIHALTPMGEHTEVTLVTTSDKEKCVEQDENLRKIQDTFVGSRISFDYEYDKSESLHARSITTDTGWKISMDRGLDVFQHHDMGPFSLANKKQEERLCKRFEITYLKQ
jgi:ATP-dependent Lon protease